MKKILGWVIVALALILSLLSIERILKFILTFSLS
jgi:hypothetical protein